MTPWITVKNDLARPGAMLYDDLIIDFALNLDKKFTDLEIFASSSMLFLCNSSFKKTKRDRKEHI